MGFTCPFCNTNFYVGHNTVSTCFIAFGYSYSTTDYKNSLNIRRKSEIDGSDIKIDVYHCPNCEKYTVISTLIGSSYNNKVEVMLYPDSKAKQYPDYVPQAIRNDYEEAHKILYLSPKSSATLSRRCIQGMIRNKWSINRKNLNEEIDAIKDNIEPSLYSSIDALRKLGNIGAHMEKDINLIIDIDPKEAVKLVKLVEILIHEWYIVPHDRELLFNEITDINSSKQEQRKSHHSEQ